MSPGIVKVLQSKPTKRNQTCKTLLGLSVSKTERI